MLKLFDASVKPILTFGSDIWGLNSAAQDKIDVFHRTFLKHLLCVKTSTCNSFVYGETGCFPLSIDLSAFTYRFFHRLINLPKTTLAKYVFDEMMRLSNLGFNSWVTKVHQSLTEIGLNDSLSLPDGKFKILCYSKLREKYICDWHASLDTEFSKTYTLFKINFSFETYLREIKIFKHRRAVAQLRCSSHHLKIETERWAKVSKVRGLRLCPTCRVLEDEKHFVSDCILNRTERATLNNYIFSVIFNNSVSQFNNFRSNYFMNLLTTTDCNILIAFGSFCYNSFKKRGKAY